MKDILFIWSYPYKKCWVSTYTWNIINEIKKHKNIDFIEISFRKDPIKSFFLYFSLIYKSFQYKNLHFQFTPLIWWPFFWFFLFFIKLLNKKANIIITTHEKSDVYIKYLPKILHSFYYFYEKIIYKNVDKIIVLSSSFKDDLVKIYKIDENKILVIPHWVYIKNNILESDILKDRKKYWLTNQKVKYIWFLWFIRENKGLHALIEYFNNSNLENTILFIWWPFSDNNYKLKILDLIAKNKENIILYENFINEKDFWIILNILDILVLPYEHITQSWIINYAITYNTPILLKESGWIWEINKDYNIARTFSDLENFKIEIKKLMTDKECMNTIKQNQTNFYNNFNFENLVKNYILNIYK